MNAPRMPPHTCRTIDKLKSRLEEAYSLAQQGCETDRLDILLNIIREIEYSLRGEIGALEDLRDANLALRTCAEYWQEQAEELQSSNQ